MRKKEEMPNHGLTSQHMWKLWLCRAKNPLGNKKMNTYLRSTDHFLSPEIPRQENVMGIDLSRWAHPWINRHFEVSWMSCAAFCLESYCVQGTEKPLQFQRKRTDSFFSFVTSKKCVCYLNCIKYIEKYKKDVIKRHLLINHLVNRCYDFATFSLSLS